MKTIEEPKTVKEILPPGWLPTLAKLCQTDRSYISGVVNDEKITSRHWPNIEALAKETDSKAYKARIEFIKRRVGNSRKFKAAA